ncbi:MAG: hypothetical protein PHH77_12770 [Victivallaceae bacterium]|nr:hypothetical protein [Victivallaceae bacterium]
MTIRRKYRIRHYTLVEVMVAMGIFLIMMTIMMQFFTSAQGLWSLSSKKNMLYSDARVAMNLMTREIRSMLYCNDETGGSGIYPFWYEWISWGSANADLPSGANRPDALKNHFLANYDLSGAGSTGNPYLTALNFIANTDLKPVVDRGADVCEIRYKFVPVYFDGHGYGLNNVRGGYLQRNCTGEYYDNSGTGTINSYYNFITYYYRTGSEAAGLGSAYQNRVDTIWGNGSADLTCGPFKTVIDGVYSLRFTCYRWDGTSLVALDPMNRIAPGQNPEGNPIAITTPGCLISYDTATGTPVPVAIRIDMKLMDPEDLKKLAVAIVKPDTGQIKILKQKMRTFSKVIYLDPRNN